MDSWTQWPSLLVPHPNPRLFNGKKRSIYRLTAPLNPCNCSPTSFMPSVTDIFRKKDILENHNQSFKPPPRIQSLLFESEPILDLEAEIAPLIAVQPPYVHGTDHAVSESNPKDSLMSNPRGHSKVNQPHPLAFVRAVTQTPTSISAKMPAPSTPSNRSFDSVPTMDEIAKSDTPLDKISLLSSSIVRRVSRRLTRKRTSERAFDPEFQSSLSGTRNTQTPASACTTPSIRSFVHPASPLPSTHLVGTNESSARDLIIGSIAPRTRYSPQGTTNSQVCGEIQAPNQIGTTSSLVQTPNQYADSTKEADEVISELPTRRASVSMLFRHFSLSDRMGSPLPSEGRMAISRSIGARRPRKGCNSQDIAKTYAYSSTSGIDTRKAGQDQGSPSHSASLSLSQLMTGTALNGSTEEGRKETPLNPAVESGILIASNSTGSKHASGMARWGRRGQAKVSGLGSVDERALVKGMTHPQTGLGTSPTAVFAINLSEEPLPTTAHIRENGYTTSFHSSKNLLANSSTTQCQDTDVKTNGTRVSKTKNVGHKARAKFTIGDDDEHGIFAFPVRKRSDDDSLPNFAQQTDATAGGYESPLPLVRSGVLISEEARLGRRRWSLANALIDERISDAGLVKEMERIRDVAARRRETRRDEPEEMGWDELDVRKVILEEWDDDEVVDGEGQRDMVKENMTLKGEGANGHSGLSESPPSEEGKELLCDTGSSIPISRSGTFIPKRHFRTTALHTRSSSAPSHSWLVAQRILFICRELILTERHYLTLLSALVHGETTSPPPTLMLQYAEELVQVSEGFLKGMEKEPSAGGVAMAFLVKEEEMEEIYVKWCGVVGDWFTGDGGAGKDDGSLLRVGVELSERVNGRRRSQSSIKKGRMGHKTDGEDNGSGSGGDREEASASTLKRTVSTWRKSVQSISSLGFEVGSIYGMGVRKRDRDKDSDKEDEQTENKNSPTIRELAILPTQRVLRYPLQYQELLSHIPPSSSSHALVERATHSACRIAGKCDRAQGNTAFIIPFSHAASRNSSRRAIQRPPKISTALSVQVTVESSVDRSSPTGSPVVSTFLSKASPPNSPKSSRGIGSTNARSRRLSKHFMSLGWGKSNPLPSSPAEDVQDLVTSSPVSNEF